MIITKTSLKYHSKGATSLYCTSIVGSLSILDLPHLTSTGYMPISLITILSKLTKLNTSTLQLKTEPQFKDSYHNKPGPQITNFGFYPIYSLTSEPIGIKGSGRRKEMLILQANSFYRVAQWTFRFHFIVSTNYVTVPGSRTAIMNVCASCDFICAVISAL